MATKVASSAQPWKGSWDKLVSNTNGWTNHTPEAVATIHAGAGGSDNYIRLARDAARAYQLALRFHGDGSTWAANKSVQIMNAWASTHTGWTGDTNVSLRAGLYGYQFACAAELMRGYSGWNPADFTAFKDYMYNRFYLLNHDFLTRRHGTVPAHYWANWEHSNLASVMAIGVLRDDQAMFDWAIDYFHNGAGNGNINHAVTYVHPNGLGQWQESGRDQGHSAMGPQLLGVICEIAWNQGHDLFGALNNRVLSSVEYISKYNLWNDVPFAPYVRDNGHPTNPGREVYWNIASWQRGTIRAGGDLVYNHYVNRMGMSAPYTQKAAEQVRPEGGGFNYGGTSGGFDGLGFTTLTHTRDPVATGAAPSGLRTTRDDWQVTLSWWGSAYAESYNVKRATSPGGPYTTVAMVGPKNMFYIDAGLTAGTTYYYVVSANAPGGESANSGEASATAVAAGGDSYQAESASYGSGAEFITSTSNHSGTGSVVPRTGYIEWTGINGGDGGPVTLAIRYSLGGPNRTGVLTVNGVQQDVPTYSTGDWDVWREGLVATTLKSGTGNTIRITSDGTDNFVYVDRITVKNSTAAPTSPVPAAPASLSATTISTSQIDLSWSAVPGAATYNIKRATSIDGPYVILDNRTGSGFSDDELSDGMTYHYVVTAINPFGESVNPSVASATTLEIPEFQESGGVVSLEAESGLLGSRWQTGADAGASNGTYIEVDPIYDWGGGSPETGAGECVAAYGFNLGTGGNYRFWFRILSGNAADDSFLWRIDGGSWHTENNRYGVGSWFSTDHPRTDAIAVGYHLLEIAYRENGTRLDKFVIQLDTLPAPVGNGPPESPPGDTTPPPAPSGFVAIPLDGKVSLDWADSGEPDFAGYTVYRSLTSGSGFTALASGIPVSQYIDESVTNGTTYHYVVTATDDASNESPVSLEASATPAVFVPIGVTASLSGVTLPGKSGPTLATSAPFGMAGGNAVALLVTSENGSLSDSITATFAGQPMSLGISANQGVQWAGIFYLINPAVTSGEFVVTTTGGPANCAYSAIALSNVSEVADTDAVANTASGGTIALTTTTTNDGGFVLGAAVNNGWNSSNPAPSFVTGDTVQALLSSVLVESSGHLHTYGNVPFGESRSNVYGNLIQRNAYVVLAFDATTQSTPLTADEIQGARLDLGSSGRGVLTMNIAASVPGHIYQIERSSDHSLSSWEDFGDPQPGNGGLIHLEIPMTLDQAREFYRIRISR